MGQANKFPTLVCGNPRIKPASFTRFVFPFAYKQMEPDNMTGLFFSDQMPEFNEFGEKRDAGRAILGRKKYFTPEISKVLFENAKWLEINSSLSETSEHGSDGTVKEWNDTWWADGVDFNCIKKTITVCMLPPRLVLFEWSEDNSSKQSKNSHPNNIFQTGFLLVDLYFKEKDKNDYNTLPGLDELLQINELFRHFDCPFPEHKEKFLKLTEKSLAEYLKPKPLKNGNGIKNSDNGEEQANAPTSAETLDNLNATINSDVCYFDFWATLLTYPVCIDNKIYRLVPKDLPQQAARFFMEGTGEASEYFVYADNRAYVWSAAIIEGSVKPLQRALRTSDWQAHEFGHWVKFLNVDFPDHDGSPSKTHNSISEFEKKWAEERTYHRWESLGTWYGFNYHSGVMLGSPLNNPPKDPPLWRHFRQHYFDIAILLFYIRITLFRFSRVLTETYMNYGFSEMENKKNQTEKTEAFEKLREKFLKFIVFYQFPLLSNQQQPIEMYELARKQFDVDKLFEEVKEEIDNMHEFLELTAARELSKTSIKLSKTGIKLANVANIIGWFGISFAISSVFLSLIAINYPELSELLGYPESNIIAFCVAFIFLIFIGTYFFFREKFNLFKDKNHE